jgi:Low-density lipoprotein receptor repeat class B
MRSASLTRSRRTIAAIALAVLACLQIASAARAADSIYWVNSETGTISHANLAGGGGGEVPVPAMSFGIGIDAAAGRLYWIGNDALNETSNIGFSNFNGGGGTVLDTGGFQKEANSLVVDPAAGRVYWADEGNRTIAFANLRGGGGGQLDTTGAVVENPGPIAIHPAAGRVFWSGGTTIAFANLAGGGGILDTGPPVNDMEGLAIDASSNRIYWTDTGTNTIGFASLGGGMRGQLDTTGAVLDEPVGLAIDPVAGKIYWTNFGNNTIGFANLQGGGGGQLDATGATTRAPIAVVLLKAPLAAVSPVVEGKLRGGAPLTCKSSWAPDLPESLLYRAPQTVTYQWLLNGRPLAGATAATVNARRVGRYACQATGTNFAGSSTATSAEVVVKAALELGKVRLNPRAGTATLRVAAFGTGKLKLDGTGLKRRVAKAAPKARLTIRATGKAAKRLSRAGRARVKVKVTFLLAGGKPIRRSKTIVLRKAAVSRR